ncbi:MAG TPA: hypothetical protein VHO90_09355 [Bacteroidales bacterium]|nr:hypothetical protein [Bacteroidales bacterium]
MKKVLVPGLVAAVGMFVAGMAIGLLFNLVFPSVKTEYENTSIFRPMDDPLMFLYFIQPLLLSFALAWVWNRSKASAQGSIWKIAFNYAFVYWIVATLPGMLMTVSSFKVTVLMTLTWTLSSFFQAFVAMLIIVRLNK